MRKRFLPDLENFEKISKWVNKRSTSNDFEDFKSDLWLLTSQPCVDQKQNFKFIDDSVLVLLSGLGYVDCKEIFNKDTGYTTIWYSLASIPYTLVLQKVLKLGNTSDRQLRQRLESEINPANMGISF